MAHQDQESTEEQMNESQQNKDDEIDVEDEGPTITEKVDDHEDNESQQNPSKDIQSDTETE